MFVCDVSCLSAFALLAHHSYRSTFLLALYVDPSHRGEGLGRALLSHTVQYLRAHQLQCSVPLQSCINRAVGSPRYVKLLRSCGFVVGKGASKDTVVIELEY